MSNCRSVTFWIPGEPVGKKDQKTTTHIRYKDKETGEWKVRQLKYPVHYKHPLTRIAENGIRETAKLAMARCGLEPFTGPVFLGITAVFVHPESWSERKKRDGHWHVTKPDGPNILELVADAGSKPQKRGMAKKLGVELKGVLWIDDDQLAFSAVRKLYGRSEGLLVTVAELDPGSLEVSPDDCQGASWGITTAVRALVGVESQIRMDVLPKTEENAGARAKL